MIVGSCFLFLAFMEESMARKLLFNGPLGDFLRKHRPVRRLALLGGVLVGIYFLGNRLGFWDRFLF
jgi:hypothetical protein